MQELKSLISLLSSFQPLDMGDRWKFSISSDDTFHVDVLMRRIDEPGSTLLKGIIDWIHEVSIKVNCFVWRANLGRIPVMAELEARGCSMGLIYV